MAAGAGVGGSSIQERGQGTTSDLDLSIGPPPPTSESVVNGLGWSARMASGPVL